MRFCVSGVFFAKAKCFREADRQWSKTVVTTGQFSLMRDHHHRRAHHHRRVHPSPASKLSLNLLENSIICTDSAEHGYGRHTQTVRQVLIRKYDEAHWQGLNGAVETIVLSLGCVVGVVAGMLVNQWK